MLPQVLRDFIDPLHYEVSEEVVPTCTIPLPLSVKLDFMEDVIKFKGSDTTTIYVKRFDAIERRFATP